jgi:hypothetical protein
MQTVITVVLRPLMNFSTLENIVWLHLLLGFGPNSQGLNSSATTPAPTMNKVQGFLFSSLCLFLREQDSGGVSEGV